MSTEESEWGLRRLDGFPIPDELLQAARLQAQDDKRGARV